MALETTTDVDSISSVMGPNNQVQSPATAEQQEAVVDRLSNPSAATTDTVTVGTDAQQLPDVPIPDNAEAVVMPVDPGSARLWVGSSSDQQPVPVDEGQRFVTGAATLAAWHVRSSEGEINVAYAVEQEADA